MDVSPFPRLRPEPDSLLTPAQLAVRWAVSRDWIYRLPADELPFVRVGSRRRYRLVAVVAYEENHMRRGLHDQAGETQR